MQPGLHVRDLLPLNLPAEGLLIHPFFEAEHDVRLYSGHLPGPDHDPGLGLAEDRGEVLAGEWPGRVAVDRQADAGVEQLNQKAAACSVLSYVICPEQFFGKLLQNGFERDLLA